MLYNHNLWLVALAGFVCATATLTASIKMTRSIDRNGTVDLLRVGFAAVALGVGVFATHMIAMLAFRLCDGADLRLSATGLSLAIVLITTSLAMAGSSFPSVGVKGRIASGVLLGFGVSLMHIVGLSAVALQQQPTRHGLGRIIVTCCGMALGAAAGAVPLKNRMRHYLIRAGLWTAMTLAIHFVDILSVEFSGLSNIAAIETPLNHFELAYGLTAACILLMAMGVFAFGAESRRRIHEAQTRRLRQLADASLEGLVIFEGARVVATNVAFARLVSRPQPLIHLQFTDLFCDVAPDFLTNPNLADPVRAQLRSPAGAIAIELSKSPLKFGNVDTVAVAVRDMRARDLSQAQIEYLVNHDVLTGLYSREAFHNLLNLGIADLKGGRAMVAIIGIDRFKLVNDAFDTNAGDAVLKIIAGRLEELISPGDGLARLSGDEFALFRPSVTREEGVCDLCRAILEQVARRIELGGGRHATLSASIGVEWLTSVSDQAAQAVANADAAMLAAKRLGGDNFVVFEPALVASLRRRQLIESELRLAIDAGALQLVFQPQALLETGEIDGYETLVRWEHPLLGTIDPVEFIKIAEESGVITILGEWILRQACQKATSWPGKERVAVNLSAVQLYEMDLPEKVMCALIDSGLSPSRLELEITETALVRDAGRARHILRRLKSVGVEIALDDFGTGFSSLSNLQNFPIDRIKIDASFVQDIDQDPAKAAIVRAVLALGAGLGKKVIAEGIETEAERNLIRQMGCSHAQGYLIGRPHPAPFTALPVAPSALAS